MVVVIDQPIVASMFGIIGAFERPKLDLSECLSRSMKNILNAVAFAVHGDKSFVIG